MGIINHDPFLSRYGYTFTDGYMALDPSSVSISKDEDSGLFNCACTVPVHVSEQAKIDGYLPIAYERVSCTFADPGAVNVYDMLYAALKTKYPNHTDVV